MLLVMLTSLWLGAARAEAHTEFESSNPADNAVVADPVSEIVLVFAGEADPAGEGFTILDATGRIRAPDTVTSDDRLSWALGFSPPLAGGDIGVRWSVAAPDAHPIEGSFSFTVSAPDLEETDEPLPENPEETDGESIDALGQSAAAAQDLGSFLEVSDTDASFTGAVGAFGRVLGLAGAMLAIGGVVFAFFVMRGTESDIRSVLFWVRRSSVVLAGGALLELLAQLAVSNQNWLTVWPISTVVSVFWSPIGLAIGLRLVGASLLLGVRLDVVDAHRIPDPLVAVGEFASEGIAGPAVRSGGGPSNAVPKPYVLDGDYAWHLNTSLGVVFAGVGAVLASFAFDGHTVTEGIRLLTSLVAVVHVAAAAIWAGGVVMLVHVVWRRHRRGADSRALQLAIRFSVVASVALVAAGVAGLALAAIVLDRVADLWSTPWGKLLLAKVAVVAVAAVAGAYNHAVLIPRFAKTHPDDVGANQEFRRAITLEGSAMVVVVVLTALLVSATS